MGKFLDNQFNKNNQQPCNCAKCRGVEQDIDVEDMTVDIQMTDPDEVIGEFYALMLEADTPDEVYGILNNLFYEGAQYGAKESILDDINIKIQMLNAIQSAIDSQEDED